MPIIKSAQKALRQSKTRNARNKERKIAFRNIIKAIRKNIADGNLEEAKKLLPEAYKALDKAAKTGAINKNTASRKKSRLTLKTQKTA